MGFYQLFEIPFSKFQNETGKHDSDEIYSSSGLVPNPSPKRGSHFDPEEPDQRSKKMDKNLESNSNVN